MLNESFLWFSNTVPPFAFWPESWLCATYCWCCCCHNREFCNHQIKGVPDVGKFVYRHVHSLHHKSYNPTAFSGTSMHPVEATLYYTAACMPALLGFHPVLALGCMADCAFGAWLGHDGFQVNRVILKTTFFCCCSCGVWPIELQTNRHEAWNFTIKERECHYYGHHLVESGYYCFYI